MDKNIILVFAVLGLVAGCSKKSSAPEVARPSGKVFQVDDADTAKLKSVSCTLENSAVTCADSSSTSPTDDVLADLQNQKKNTLKRKQVVDEVEKNIAAALKNGGLEIKSELDARGLDASLISLSVNLLAKSTQEDIDILQEQNFQNVLGYRCTGTYVSTGGTTPITQNIMFTNSDQTLIVPNPGGADLLGQIMFNATNKELTWKMADSQDESKRTVKQRFTSSSEFTQKIAGNPALDISCLKFRVSGMATQLTDHPVAQHPLKCSYLGGLPDAKNQGRVPGFSVTFSSYSHDANNTVDFGESISINDAAPTVKYGIKLVSNAGLLILTTYDRASGKVVLETKLPNSTATFTQFYEDQLGNEAQVVCTTDTTH